MSTTWLRYKISDSLGRAAQLLGAAALAAVAYVLHPHLLLVVLLVAVGLLPFFMYKCIEFDLYRGIYRTGIRFAGKTFGREEPYPGVAFLFLKKNRHISETGSRYARFNTIDSTFDGFIKMADGTKLLLIRIKDKQKALLFLARIARDLEVEVRDFTEGRYY